MTTRLEAYDVAVRRGGRRVLSSFSVRLSPGALVGLVGPNGSGKTSALEALAGVIPIEAGLVRLGGAPLSTLNARARAAHVALIGRELAGHVPLTVTDVVELGALARVGPLGGLSAEDSVRIDGALKAARCTSLSDRPLLALSEGERQRVHVARAFAQAAHVLLMDEAAAHLDLEHREDTLERVQEFVRTGGAALVAIHELDLAARYCDRLIVLDGGMIVAEASPRDALTPKLLSDVFGVEARLVADARGLFLRVFGRRRVENQVGGAS